LLEEEGPSFSCSAMSFARFCSSLKSGYAMRKPVSTKNPSTGRNPRLMKRRAGERPTEYMASSAGRERTGKE
jgi:hypothetical protein